VRKPRLVVKKHTHKQAEIQIQWNTTIYSKSFSLGTRVILDFSPSYFFPFVVNFFSFFSFFSSVPYRRRKIRTVVAFR